MSSPPPPIGTPVAPTRIAVAATAWVTLIQFFVVQVVAQWASTAPYHVTRQFISDLGNTACAPYRYYTTDELVEVCSAQHALVNTSFIVSGLLLITGLLLAWSHWPRHPAITTGKTMIVFAGLGWAIAGLSPENENIFVHSMGAMLLVVGGNAGVLILGLVSRSRAGWRVHGTWTLVTGAIGTAATILYFTNQYLGLGLGTMERLAAYPLVAWAIATGLGWLTSRRRSLASPAIRV
ncbi:DUF998 domain-containing protein [Planotetraspora phitsanulokensis]|uniref:DUF998 domain-containing protein n=1 Tax=Planotetraspora phitsanulokensis TaxID=575192 RepID=A0A8J3U3D1_9ACTN|nr:DUF998 domain-containing protein [Planotetraspora phitsanulokensis]GII37828.1 hypothetical protein Pph01_28310 [Planotetraspora phitsanulokensis]